MFAGIGDRIKQDLQAMAPAGCEINMRMGMDDERYFAVFRGSSIQAELAGWWTGGSLSKEKYDNDGAAAIHGLVPGGM